MWTGPAIASATTVTVVTQQAVSILREALGLQVSVDVDPRLTNKPQAPLVFGSIVENMVDCHEHLLRLTTARTLSTVCGDYLFK
jgi:hypothetical protein